MQEVEGRGLISARREVSSEDNQIRDEEEVDGERAVENDRLHPEEDGRAWKGVIGRAWKGV